jgi:hypothetical protein
VAQRCRRPKGYGEAAGGLGGARDLTTDEGEARVQGPMQACGQESDVVRRRGTQDDDTAASRGQRAHDVLDRSDHLAEVGVTAESVVARHREQHQIGARHEGAP